MAGESAHPTTIAPPPLEPEYPEAGEVRAQVERVLNSPLFRSSQRCQALLRYVAERALCGETTGLKERTLGVEVFGRPPDYDTNAEPVVRSTAGEIRKKLAQYYQDPEHAGELRIELNRGAYLPVFHAAPVTTVATEPPKGRLPSRRTWMILLGVLIVTGPGVFVFANWRKPALERFWEPVFESPGGVLFSVAQSRAYNFRSDARQREIEKMIQGMSPAEIASSGEMIPFGDLVPMWDRYLAVGDVTCLLRLASVFEKRGKPYHIRSEAATSFSDLRERPSILVGAFDNGWTLRAVGEMRFTFFKDFEGLEVIRDRDHPENNAWQLRDSWPQWHIANDYAIVSRVFDKHTDRVVVIAAGITQFGTAGAGEFLSNPQYFSEAIPALGRGWQRKNLQIVLRIPVVQGVTGHPQVLATEVW